MTENKYISNAIANMPSSGIRKFFDVASTLKGAISLGVGEPDFETPWYAREAAIVSLEKGITSYTSNQGMMELREAISEYLFEKYNTKY
ncbi:MAG: pyridoxal phosphate-dependent aminotransferase, partial [Firmicutes bacterium]|nr:pyridoxal phosphate-dependent aminotransferase [Bacillota bacterium]